MSAHQTRNFFDIDAQGTLTHQQKYAVTGLACDSYSMSIALINPRIFISDIPTDDTEALLSYFLDLQSYGYRFEENRTASQAFKSGIRSRVKKFCYSEAQDSAEGVVPFTTTRIAYRMVIDAAKLTAMTSDDDLSGAVSQLSLRTTHCNTIASYAFTDIGKLSEEYPGFYESRHGQMLISTTGLARRFRESAALYGVYDKKRMPDDKKDVNSLGSLFVYGAHKILQTVLVGYAQEKNIPLITYNHNPENEGKAYLGLITDDDAFAKICPMIHLMTPVSHFNALQLASFRANGRPLMNEEATARILTAIDANGPRSLPKAPIFPFDKHGLTG